MFLISAAVAFVLTWLFGYKDPEELEAAKKEGIVYAPVEGTAIPYTEIADPTFASGALGQGPALPMQPN